MSDSARRDDLRVLHPIVRSAVEKVIAELEKENLPFKVFEAFRTPARQRMLYAQGRTTPGDIVTNARAWSSYHQYGLAVDFVLFIDGTWSWNSKGTHKKQWERLHEIGRAHDLEPLSWELPHLQYKETSIEKLRSGDYPPLGDDAWADNVQAAVADWSGAEDAPPLPQQSGRPAIKPLASADDDDGLLFGRLTQAVDEAVPEQLELGLTAAIIQAAQASDRLWQIPASVTLAQYILESARGTRMPLGSNNPFGIKARTGDAFVAAPTKEVVNGRTVTVVAKFRKFASLDEAFSYHGKLLATSPYYKKAMSCTEDPSAFANALTGIYATDPNYGSKLVQLIKKYDLAAYDNNNTTVAQERPASSEAAGMSLDFGDRGENVKALQMALKAAGYSVGAIDGRFGSFTRAGVAAFQADNSLKITGGATVETLALLNDPPARRLDRERVTATEGDLLKDGSITIKEARRTKALGWITGILGALGIGNSAVVNGASETTSVNATSLPVDSFLSQVQTVLGNAESRTDVVQLDQLLRSATDLSRAIRAGGSPELAQLARQLRQMLPADVASRYPDLDRVFTVLTTANDMHSTVPRTIFDLFPSVFGSGGSLEPISSVAASVVPGFGGSIAALGVGFLAHYFGNKISQARVQEHREGSNLSR